MVFEKIEEYTLTTNDRCDADCSAQAYVKAIGVSGELLFCSHHWNAIVDNAVGYDAMEKFAYQVVDERDRLKENRTKGED